jgi:hypothetical protein
MLPVALSFGDAMLIIVFVAIPLAAITFLGAGTALKQVGKGRFGVEFEHDFPQKAGGTEEQVSDEVREQEIRQLVEAKAYRQRHRGERPLDVDAEVEKLMADQPASDLASDKQLVSEVRSLVVARTGRRARRGEEPLDVDAEVERQLRELESLGQ